MQSHTKPQTQSHTKLELDTPKLSALLVEAVNNPGLIMDAYCAFHNYSIGNQILAIVQCQLAWPRTWPN